MKEAKSGRSLNRGSIIISTFQSRKSANIIAKKMISKKLCACVNIIKINSFYYWKNKLQYDNEYLCFFKTVLSTKLKNELRKIHPYELPEIVEIKMDSVDQNYLRWLMG